MIRVSIVGASGYSGVYLIQALSSRPDVSISVITSNSNAGKKLSDFFPLFAKTTPKNPLLSEIKFSLFDEDLIGGSSDAVFFCLPHNESSKLIPAVLKKNKDVKIIDVGADFRFDDVSVYERHYGKHNAPELNGGFVYGLSDVFYDKIENSQFIANPGCYPTGALLPILPLVFKGCVDFSFPVIIDSMSGISGAGRGLKLQNLFCEIENSAKAYNVWTHRHLPEIKEKIEKAFLDSPPHQTGKLMPDVIFTPHVIPVSRGILTTVYLKLNKGLSKENITAIYKNFYCGSPFVSILNNIEDCNIKNVIYTNNCHIAFEMREENGGGSCGSMIKIVSAIDNLGKGASLQAIQNMNLMFGLEPDFGIPQYSPYP
jgi:N-acetyl-gamma-glutamyl-phosphate reductase